MLRHRLAVPGRSTWLRLDSPVRLCEMAPLGCATEAAQSAEILAHLTARVRVSLRAALAGASSQQEFIRATRHLGVHGVGAARAELLARGSILAA